MNEGLKERTAEALIEGVFFRDYTHWRKADHISGPVFGLELGRGFTITAYVPERTADTQVLYKVSRTDRVSRFVISSYQAGIYGDFFCIDIPSGHLSVGLGDLDADAFIERKIEAPIKYGYPFHGFRGDGVLAIVCGEGEYAGDPSGPGDVDFESDVVKGLYAAVSRQDFSRIREQYGGYGEAPIGIASLSFHGMSGARYCSEIKGRASGHDGPFSFHVSGVLTSDEDGLMIKGTDASFTVLVPQDLRGWDDDDFLEEYPVPDWSSYVKDMERFRRARDGGP